MVSERSEEQTAENLDSAESLDEATYRYFQKLVAERKKFNRESPNLNISSYADIVKT